jgi:hypothetical protein
MADTVVSLGIETHLIGAEQTLAGLDQINARAKALSATQQQAMDDLVRGSGATKLATKAQTDLAQAAKDTGKSTSILGSMFGALVNWFRPYSQGAEGASASMGHLAGAHGEVAKSMHLLNAIAYSTGGSIAGLGQIAMLARAGLAFLAAGIAATVIVSLEKAAESLDKVKAKMEGALGSGKGAKAFNDLRAATDNAHNSMDAFAEGVILVMRALDRGNHQFFTFNNGEWESASMAMLGMGTSVSKVAGQMSNLIQVDKENGTAAGKMTDDYLKAWAQIDTATGKTTGLTLAAFKTMETAAPTLARAITAGIGAISFDQVERKLTNLPMTINQTLEAIARGTSKYQPAIDAMKVDPTVVQSWDRMKTAIVSLWEELGKGDGIAGRVFGAITTWLDTVNEKIKKGQGFISALFSPPQGWSTMFNQANDLIDRMIGKLNTAINKKNELAGAEGGAMAGALVGAGTGAVVGGSLLGPPGAVGGALVGGFLGGGMGGIIGNLIGGLIDDSTTALGKDLDKMAQVTDAAKAPVTALGGAVDTFAASAKSAADSISAMPSAGGGNFGFAPPSMAAEFAAGKQVPTTQSMLLSELRQFNQVMKSPTGGLYTGGWESPDRLPSGMPLARVSIPEVANPLGGDAGGGSQTFNFPAKKQIEDVQKTIGDLGDTSSKTVGPIDSLAGAIQGLGGAASSVIANLAKIPAGGGGGGAGGFSDPNTFIGRSGTLDYLNPNGSRTISINDVFDPQAYGGGQTKDALTAAAAALAAGMGLIETAASSAVGPIDNFVTRFTDAMGQIASTKIPSGGSGGSGPSFTYDTNINTPLEGFASGGIARVMGSGSTDKTLVQFMATNGEVVAVGNPSAANASSGSSGLAVQAITQPITTAVQSSTSQIVSAINNSTINTSSTPAPFGKAGTATAPLGSGPIDAYGNVVSTHQSEYVSMIQKTDGGRHEVYSVNPSYAGPFANGGSFMVGGSGGTDSKRVSMDVTPGELVSVTPQSKKRIGGESQRPIVFNFPNHSAQSFMASGAQVARALRNSLR